MTSNKIVNQQKLNELVASWHDKKLEIVFTNGCFDIVHLGHIDYLEKASALGDKMVVGLNTDLSVSKLKGSDRPINNEYARARLLASMTFVDAVILFGSDTPLELIKVIEPDILVKGNDYLTENIVGADIVMKNGGRVETIQLVEGYSSTSIIEKIKNT